MPIEVFDAGALAADWQRADFDDSAWRPARVLAANHLGFGGRHEPPIAPYGALRPRPIALLDERATRFHTDSRRQSRRAGAARRSRRNGTRRHAGLAGRRGDRAALAARARVRRDGSLRRHDRLRRSRLRHRDARSRCARRRAHRRRRRGVRRRRRASRSRRRALWFPLSGARPRRPLRDPSIARLPLSRPLDPRPGRAAAAQRRGPGATPSTAKPARSSNAAIRC